MSTLTTIANEAFSLIRAKGDINDIENDQDANAKSARMFLTEHINELLEELDLRAFSKTVAMGNITASDPPPPGWSYRYAYPSDCVLPREVSLAEFVRNSTPIPFDIEMLATGSDLSILCDVADAHVRYTSNFNIKTVDRWPHNFRRAVTYRLAASLATSIKENPNMAQMMMNMYVDASRMASFANHSGRNIGPSQEPASTRSRRS